MEDKKEFSYMSGGNAKVVKRVVMETTNADGEKVMNVLQILDVVSESDGLTIIVR
ncbi:MAG: hypothetical protein AB7J46_06585 [Candidatus Altimarinota bacterium]